jgi:hypothetical protein
MDGVRVYIVTPDVIPPEHRDKLLIHVHGGCYVLYPGESGTAEAIMMAGLGHFKVVSVDYRMPPEAYFPGALDDAMTVYKAALKTTDPKNIAVFGTSAGGALVLEMMLRAKQLAIPLPGAVAPGTPMADVTKTGDSFYTNEMVDNVLVSRDGFCDAATCIGATLVLPDFYRLKKENRLARKNLLPPYYMCAQTVLMEAGFQMVEANVSRSLGDTLFLKPIFDSHQRYEGRMKKGVAQFCTKNPSCSRYLNSPDYEDEKTHRALQAADNIAYESRRYLMYRHFSSTVMPRISMSRMLNSGAFLRLYKLDYRALKIIAEGQSVDKIPIAPADVNLSEISDRNIGTIPNDGTV